MRLLAILLCCIASAPVWAQINNDGNATSIVPNIGGYFGRSNEFFLTWDPFPQQRLEQRADMEIERGNYGLAASLLKEARRLQSPGMVSWGTVERREARLYWTAGKYSDAEKTLLAGRKWKPADALRKLENPIELVTLGEVYLVRGETATARPLLKKASDVAKGAGKQLLHEWIRARNDLALLNLRDGKLAEAADLLAENYHVAEKAWGGESIPLLDTLDLIGQVRTALGQFDQAEAALDRAARFRLQFYGNTHCKVADSYLHAAQLRVAQHDATAAAFLERAVQTQKDASAGGPNGRWAIALIEAANVYASLGDAKTAEEYYRNALPILASELGTGSTYFQQSQKRYLEFAKQ